MADDNTATQEIPAEAIAATRSPSSPTIMKHIDITVEESNEDMPDDSHGIRRASVIETSVSTVKLPSKTTSEVDYDDDDEDDTTNEGGREKAKEKEKEKERDLDDLPSADQIILQSMAAGAAMAAMEDDDDDDDEDSMDDLDDMLDEFSGPKAATGDKVGESSKQAASSSKNEAPPSLGDLDDDFAQQLQQGMVDLLKGMEDSPELQAQFDSLVQELDKATATSSKDVPPSSGEGPVSAGKKPAEASPASASASSAAQQPADFHERIAETMARMRDSGQEIDTELADANTDDFLAEMLKQMQMASGEGSSEEDFSKMLMGMMEQLTNKEILYEPMKELDEKFPNWLATNEGKHTPEEFAKFREQAQIVREIVAKFDEPTYKDSVDKDREYVVERMQKMQTVGSPPAELLGEMSGTGMDGLPPDIENCPVQ